MDIGSHIIPGGSLISVPLIHIHRNKSIWGDDADEFKPERFLPESFAKIHSRAYLPFLRGARNCIGKKYALNSMKVYLSHFFRNFEVSTTLKMEDIDFQYVVVTKILPGCMVSIQKREFNKI